MHCVKIIIVKKFSTVLKKVLLTNLKRYIFKLKYSERGLRRLFQKLFQLGFQLGFILRTK